MPQLATHAVDSPAGNGASAIRDIDWGAVVAGALLAAALSLVLLTFGAAIGLSATSPWPNAGLPAAVVASLAVFWTLAQQIGSLLAGGYVAGRMRSPARGIDADEVGFRDGLHGALVWSLGALLGAALALTAGGALLRAGSEVATKAVSADDLTLDAMLRSASGAAAPGEARAELSRLVASSLATGSLPEQSRAYLVQRVSQLAGLSLGEAQTRVNEALVATRKAADKARRAAILTGLVTATSMLLALGAAWWAAVKGGQHRDNAVPARLFRDRSLPRPRVGT